MMFNKNGLILIVTLKICDGMIVNLHQSGSFMTVKKSCLTEWFSFVGGIIYNVLLDSGG